MPTAASAPSKSPLSRKTCKSAPARATSLPSSNPGFCPGAKISFVYVAGLDLPSLDPFAVWRCVGVGPDPAPVKAADGGGQTFTGATPAGSDDPNATEA